MTTERWVEPEVCELLSDAAVLRIEDRISLGMDMDRMYVGAVTGRGRALPAGMVVDTGRGRGRGMDKVARNNSLDSSSEKQMLSSC